MKKQWVLIFLLTATSAYAGPQFDNIYVTANIEEHLPEFLAMEFTKDMRESIAEYNLHRKDPAFFAARIKDPGVLKLFNQNTRKIALPEIKQKNEMFWMMKAGKNTVEFNAELFLNRRYYLNGEAKILSNGDLTASIDQRDWKKIVFNLMLDQAIADDDEDFDAAYKDLDSTKVLMASIIALDTSFKSRGVLDKIPMMNDVADINAKNLVRKIESYNSECEENLKSQDTMMRGPRSDWNSLGTLERYSMMRSLKETADPAYQHTLALIRKIAAENTASSYQRDKKLAETFNTEKKTTCEATLTNIFEESKNKTNRLAAYIDGGNSAKVAAANHPCTKMAQLKVCLSKFATQASSINDFVRKRNADAKEVGVQAYPVPDNYPSVNSGR